MSSKKQIECALEFRIVTVTFHSDVRTDGQFFNYQKLLDA